LLLFGLIASLSDRVKTGDKTGKTTSTSNVDAIYQAQTIQTTK